ncbi:MAG: DUF1440 domain-containing protein [Acidobacteria bacterium]|nr:DUF1440 domain-containing protein [Acidobacteriota bacterium]
MARRNLWTGMAAGMAGGLAGSYAMGLAHQYLSRAAKIPAPGGAADATALAAEAIAGRSLTVREKQLGSQLVHYGFGALMGGLYGAAAAAAPRLGGGRGMPFGAALYFGAHGYAVPRLGLAESPMDKPLPTEGMELAAHLVYGLVTDAVRRILR